MWRGLSRNLVVLPLMALMLANAQASGPARIAPTGSILERFLALDDPPPTQFRALRHLEARNDHFEKSAWMDVWTEVDAFGFRYQIVAEEGSGYIRSHLFHATLETEREMWAAGAPDKARLTLANYIFEDRGAQPDGLTLFAVKPRRDDVLLVDGLIFLNPDDGELVRVEGRLSKTPSFWTRRVEIVRRFQRIVGVRMPIALESVANLRIAGEATFRMRYEYESVNGQRVGAPEVRASSRQP
jgi:hypothetical protein